MKRMLSLALSALFLIFLSLPAAAAENASPFTDVSPDDYFYSPVLWAVGGDVTQGVGDGKFSPWTICTRGQVVTFLWRAMGFPEPQSETNPFTDVRESDYFCKPVLWAVEQGITNGTSADAFSPEQTCSCAHILTFLWRAMGKTEPGSPSPVSGRFPDGWYSSAVSWAEYQGLLDGFKETFDINEPCSRALTVTYLFRALVYRQAQWGGEWDPVVIQRQALADEGALCGAYHIGSFPEPRDQNELINELDFWYQILEDCGILEDFAFLRELPASQIIQVGGGRDVFLIIPADRFFPVTVTEWSRDASGGLISEELYRSSTGAPFLLCCNRTEDFPDAQVIITGENGNVLDWYPQLSKEDGRLVTVSNGMEIFDFTVYPEDGGEG